MLASGVSAVDPAYIGERSERTALSLLTNSRVVDNKECTDTTRFREEPTVIIVSQP